MLQATLQVLTAEAFSSAMLRAEALCYELKLYATGAVDGSGRAKALCELKLYAAGGVEPKLYAAGAVELKLYGTGGGDGSGGADCGGGGGGGAVRRAAFARTQGRCLGSHGHLRR